ncbi:hypothetical protein ACFYMC_29690, partial [Streptomyces sp. NPDC006879]
LDLRDRQRFITQSAQRPRRRPVTSHAVAVLADAEPDTMRFGLYHLPARLSRHARRRWLRIDTTWPWARAFTAVWSRITGPPAVT